MPCHMACHRIILLYIIFIFSLCNLIQQTIGKCISFSEFSAPSSNLADLIQSFAFGPRVDLCRELVGELYDEFWVDDTIMNQLTDSTTCYAGSVLDDVFIQPITNLFTMQQPTSVCQKAIMVQSCLYHYPRCNSQIDIQSHITKEQNKLCTWFCNAIVSPNTTTTTTTTAESFCTLDDWDYLSQFGLFKYNIGNYIPALDCTNSTIYSLRGDDDDKSCLIKTIFPTEPPTSRCEIYRGTICQFYGDNTFVYLPPGLSQTTLETQLEEKLFILNSLPTNDSDQCIADYLRYICTSTFPECLETPQNIEMMNGDGQVQQFKIVKPIALRPPLNICQNVLTSCSDTPFWQYLQDMGGIDLTPFDCETRQTYGFNPCLKNQNVVYQNFVDTYQYQPVILHTPNPNVSISAQSYAGSTFQIFVETPTSSITPCPAPLMNAPDYIPYSLRVFGGRCTPTCPHSNNLSLNERRYIIIITRIASTIITITSLLLVVSFLIFKTQRRKRSLLWYTIAYSFVPLMICINSFYGDYGYTYQCATNILREHFNGFSLFIALFIVYFYLASCTWWLCCAVDLFQRLILLQQYVYGTKSYYYMQICQHLFAWGVPLICIAALCVGRYLGYDGNLPFSFLSPDPSVKKGIIQLEWIFFFLPVVFTALVGFLMIGVVFIFLLRYQQQTSSSTTTTNVTSVHPKDTPPQSNFKTKEETTTTTTGVNNNNDINNDNQTGNQNDIVGAEGNGSSPAPLERVDSFAGSDDGKYLKHLAKKGHTALGVYDRLMHSNRSFCFKLQQSLKLWGFILIMLIQIVIFLIYQITVAKNQKQYDIDLENYENCLVSTNNINSCKLMSRLPPSIIIVGVFSLLAPGGVIFLLYFVFSPQLLKLWASLFVHKFGMTFLASWASDDTFSDSQLSASTISHGSAGSHESGGSNDLLGHADLFLRPPKTPDGKLFLRRASGAGLDLSQPKGLQLDDFSLNSDNNNNNSATNGSYEQQQSQQQNQHRSARQVVQRRQQLFKGFSKPTNRMYNSSTLPRPGPAQQEQEQQQQQQQNPSSSSTILNNNTNSDTNTGNNPNNNYNTLLATSITPQIGPNKAPYLSGNPSPGLSPQMNPMSPAMNLPPLHLNMLHPLSPPLVSPVHGGGGGGVIRPDSGSVGSRGSLHLFDMQKSPSTPHFDNNQNNSPNSTQHYNLDSPHYIPTLAGYGTAAQNAMQRVNVQHNNNNNNSQTSIPHNNSNISIGRSLYDDLPPNDQHSDTHSISKHYDPI